MVRQRSVQKLQEALQDLEREVVVRAERLEQLKSSIQQLRDLIAFITATADDAVGAPSSAVPPRTRAHPTKTARNALVDILRDAGGPMHSRDLLSELQQRGIEVGGKDPANNVRSYLSHDTRFVPCGQGLWDLKSRANGVRTGPVVRPLDFDPISSPPENPPDDPVLDQTPESWDITDDWVAAHEPEEDRAMTPF